MTVTDKNIELIWLSEPVLPLIILLSARAGLLVAERTRDASTSTQQETEVTLFGFLAVVICCCVQLSWSCLNSPKRGFQQQSSGASPPTLSPKPQRWQLTSSSRSAESLLDSPNKSFCLEDKREQKLSL